MSSIPTGNVTFLFTDIEGSTKLSQEFPDMLPAALEKHNTILSKAIESNNGFIFEIIGDAFCCAFRNAGDAVKAAVDTQIILANEKWDDAIIKVRMGIHSGNAEWSKTGQRYMGYITLARTSRVMSAAYGEQIIISNSTHELTKDKFNYVKEKNISFRDLGERRLKDVIQPVRLFQIEAQGLKEDFPPLKTLDARPNNLPVQLTSFIGREAEMKRVKNLLKQTHLLTLTGSGGSGKTRLALQVAADVIDDFANGVWFVELASLFEPALLPQAIMKVFGLKEEVKKSLENTLCDYLKEKEVLILLDNCEHLVEPCAKLAKQLLINSPKLKIIATSREALRCEGEQTHRVLSLEVPDPKEENSPEKLSQYEAVRLFIERALAVDENFRVNNDNAPALAQICCQLDGIPLALELAAARTNILSVEKIFERLNDRFNLLSGGKRTALPRQQTLKAMIEWSYNLLSEEEKLLWARLSVFAGGWTLEAAEEVCSDEELQQEKILNLLNSLQEKSIIIYNYINQRYQMLETILQYGKNLLKGNSTMDILLNRHAEFYANLTFRAGKFFIGSENIYWLNKLELEESNFHSALTLNNEKKININVYHLLLNLGNYWRLQNKFVHGQYWYNLIMNNKTKLSDRQLFKLYTNAGIFERMLGNIEKAKKYFKNSISLFRKSRSEDERLGYLNAMQCLGNLERDLGKYNTAIKLFEECLIISKELNLDFALANILMNLSSAVFLNGNVEKGIHLQEQSLIIYEKLGDKIQISRVLNNLGFIHLQKKDYVKSKEYFEKSLLLSKDINDEFTEAMVTHNLGTILKLSGDFSKSYSYFKKGLLIMKKLGYSRGIGMNLASISEIYLELENFILSTSLISFTESLKMSLTKEDLINNQGLISRLRKKLSHNEFSEYWDEGKSLTLEQAIELAVGKDEDKQS